VTSWCLKISPQAQEDLAWFRKNNRIAYQKSFDLTLAVIENPFEGIGKPEQLRFLGGNVWSRRVTHEHRMVYEIFEELIMVAAYRHHYGKG